MKTSSPISSMQVTLRDYSPEDFETLYAIDQACYARGIAYSRRTLRWFLQMPGADCLVAETNRVVGFIIAEAGGTDGHIITLDVVAEHRREGIGTSLLAEMERRLCDRGVREVSLETSVENAAGVAFWQRHDYRVTGRLRRYYLGRVDALAMTKHLVTRGS